MKLARQINKSLSRILLIVPQGIEITFRTLSQVPNPKLLIVPQGIEMDRKYSNIVQITGLLIVPQGIEIPFFVYLLGLNIASNRTTRN